MLLCCWLDEVLVVFQLNVCDDFVLQLRRLRVDVVLRLCCSCVARVMRLCCVCVCMLTLCRFSCANNVCIVLLFVLRFCWFRVEVVVVFC